MAESPTSPNVQAGMLGIRNASFSSDEVLREAMQRHITEFDLAAYSKDEFTVSMERNIMKRMFDAFDVLSTGSLDSVALKQLLAYLGHQETSSLGRDLLSSENVTFERFWEHWQLKVTSAEVTPETFAMVSSAFKVPYHQQQLIIEEVGQKYTLAYRVNFFFRDMETTEMRQVSPWHDIPLVVRDIVRTTPESVPTNRYNFICEIPKWTRAKFEISTTETYNPIKQDMKNGVPRFYKHGDMMWNYGAFPQTWESTDVDFVEGVKGDNDPLDGIEIGMTQLKTGSVTPIKVLGVLGMIDDGQMDWKIICVNHADAISRFLEDIDDVPKFLPGCLEALREWLRVYKICQGGVENKFAFNGEFRDKAFAMKVISESHRMWENLRKIRQTAHFS
jgi:inorganic pyrophosphatase